MLVALAADPVAGLVDTAVVGRLGTVQLAGMAVGLSIFGTITKFLNLPIVSSTTTTVANAAGGAQVRGQPGAQSQAVSSAASAAIAMAAMIGVAEAVVISAGAGAATALWGLAPHSPAHQQAVAFLATRALGAPFQVLLLTLQGCFRGLQDTRTPLAATLASNALNVALAPALIFGAGWGVRGAAAAIQSGDS